MRQTSILDIGAYPFWKLITTSDVRNTVNVTKVQGKNTELISIPLEGSEVFLSSFCNSLRGAFS